MSLEAGPSNASDSPRRRSWWGGLSTGSVKSRGKQPDQETAEDNEEIMLSDAANVSRNLGGGNQRGQPPAYDTLATSVPTEAKPRARLQKSSKGARGAPSEPESEIRPPVEDNVMAVTTQTVTTTTTTTTQIFPLFTRARASSKPKRPSAASIEEAPPIPERSSSKQPRPAITRSLASNDKDHPPLPDERPLPPIPNFLEKLSAVPPQGIVVTPSSPHKPYHPDQKREASTAVAPYLGLGLPSPMFRTSSDSPTITQGTFQKQQSVSSPLPSRSPSPSPKISFAEPPEDREGRSRQNSVDDSQPKVKQVKRVRSLSQLFGAKTDEPEVEPAPAATGLFRGAAEWLGVRKPVRRRSSESKLRDEAQLPPTSNRSASQVDLPTRNFSRTSSYGSAIEPDTVETMLPIKETTDAFGTSPGPVKQTLFNRRASPAVSDGKKPPPSPIASSHPSFILPAVDDESPMELGFVQDGWVESPSVSTADAEDFLFVQPTKSSEGRLRTRTNTWAASSSSSPLGSLPEHGLSQAGLPVPVETRTLGVNERRRAWSDVPPATTSSQASGGSTPMEELALSTSASSQPPSSPPTTPRRPSLGGRSSSSSSAVITRVRSVLRPSNGRSRSSSLLRNEAGVDDFGALFTSKPRPGWLTSSSSSSLASPVRSPFTRLPLPTDVPSPDASESNLPTPHRLRLPPSDGYRGQDSPLSSARSSMDRELTGRSVPQPFHRTTTALPHEMSLPSQSHMPPPGSRARSSTVSAAQNVAPPSTYSASPSRRRPGSLRRLSTGLFGGSSSPKAGGLFPLPARSSVGSFNSNTAPLMSHSNSSQGSFGRSPRASNSSFGATARKAVPRREEQELPSHWLHRLLEAVSRAEVANVLAASGDDFHTQALKLYMNRFDFTHDALDVAIRRLLMDIALPRETQQIDRVIEAFAKRYEECEPDLFPSKDTAYVLAFSLMMLHTDAFNRNNKNKMTKADYVRNTRMDGVPPVVLEVFFDNITFTPFVFIDDDTDVNGQRSLAPETPALTGTVFTSSTSSSLAAPPKNNKVDVYHLIVRGITGTLRVDVQSRIPSESPYSCLGTRPFLDPSELHRSFANAHTLQIVAPKPRRKSSATLMEPTRPRGSSIGSSGAPVPDPDLTLKVTKVGLLSRKDDLIEGGKKAGNRKWKSWSVILTGSQLLFFKDPTWALSLLDQARSTQLDGESPGQLLFPRMTTFKPDEVFSVKDSIAIYDRSYTKYPHTFRFIMPHGRQYLMQASDEFELNEWMARINYAGAFKTASVRMRGMGMTGGQAVLAGAAAAASHNRAVQHSSAQNSRKTTVFGGSSTSGTMGIAEPGENASVAGSSKIDIDGANNVVLDDGEELAVAFNTIKAELASGRGGATRLESGKEGEIEKGSATRASYDSGTFAAGHASRIEAVELRVRDFKASAHPIETQLCSDLRLARNYAVLTPFQRITKERIESELPALARRISSARVELAKLHFWIDVLEKDVEQERRDWSRVRHVALQAAASSLRDPGGVAAVVQKASSIREGLAVPSLNLNDTEGHGGMPFGTSPGELPEVMTPQSGSQSRGVSSHRSSTSSFHSAQEDVRTDSNPSSPIAISRVRLQGSGVRDSGEDTGLGMRTSGSRTVSSPFPLLEREEPEDWQKTRAGRRVSLATMSQDQMRRLSQRRRPPPKATQEVDLNDDEDEEATGHMDA